MISAAEAAAAYKLKVTDITKSVSAGPKIEGNEATAASSGSRFVDMVKGVAQNAIDTNYRAEQLSQAGIAGKADLTEVVTAVTNAEATLQTVVTIRDRVIRSYQEILKMPI